MVRRTYAEFERRAGEVRSPRGAKTQLVEQAIASALGAFGLAELKRQCPGVSRDTIRLVLRALKAQGVIECLGRGPGAKWRKKGNFLERGEGKG